MGFSSCFPSACWLVVMSVVRQHLFFKNVQQKAISVFAFWRRSIHGSKSKCFSSSNDSSRELLDCLTHSWGLRSGEATELCRKVKTTRPSVQKLERVVVFLRESSFTDTQIRKAITMNPQLLTAKVDVTLLPKMKAFQGWGLSTHDIAYMVGRNPHILNSSLEENIQPIVGILKTVLPGDKNLAAAIKSLFSGVRVTHNVEKLGINLSNLRSRGVPDSSLSTILVTYPTIFQLDPSSLERMVEKAHKFGFDYTSGMFPCALQALCGLKESTWDAKLEVLRGFGWSEENIVTAFRKAPLFMGQSRSNLQQKLEFFMNELKLLPSQLAAVPLMLMFSLEKRVIPRVSVMRKLESSKLFNRNWGLTTILGLKEKKFYDEMVLKHKDKCPEVLQVYSSLKKSEERRES